MVEEYIDKASKYIFEVLPEGWSNLVLYAELDAMHYNIFFYTKVSGKYVQCYNLDNICDVSEEEIDAAIEKWYQIALKNKKDETWKSYTVNISNSGSFQIDYVYDEEFDLDDWKKEYLQ